MNRYAVAAEFILIVAAFSASPALAGSHGNGHQSTPPPAPTNNAPPVAESLNSGALKIDAQPVAPAAEDQNPQRIMISPDGHHVAFVSIRGSRFAVVVDGKPSGKYDEIGHTNNAVNKEITFSADGQHVMYIARRGDDQMAVVDGQELVGYALVDQFSFSPDGKQNAFVGRHDLQNATPVMVVLNGKEGPGYYSIDGLQFSSNNAHVAYISTVKDPSKPENTSLVMDGKNEKLFYHVHDFRFSGDGNHWAYVGDDFLGNVKPGTSVQGAHLMVDGKELAAFESIYGFQISADGHVAYTANKQTHMSAQSEMLAADCAGLDSQVWDVANGHRFPAHGASPFYLSPDGQHVAWLEERPGNNELSLSVNGKHGLGYHGIESIAFSPDSQHINYVARQSSNGNYVVRDEDESGPYAPVPTIYLSPNGKHIAFKVASSNTAFVVEDGKQQTTYESIYGPLVFSPDGEHLAYIAQAKDPTMNMTPIQRQQAMQSPSYSRGQYIVLDGKEQPVLPNVKFGSAVNFSALHFSPDSKHLAYTDDLSKVVIDGRMASRAVNTQNGSSMNGLDGTFKFTPDSKHAVWAQSVLTTSGNSAVHYMIDGDEAAGYQLAGKNGSTLGVANYQASLQPDGGIFFFATKDSDQRGMPVSPALYRITVNPGPERDFGTTAATAIANTPPAANTPPTQQQSQTPQTPPPSNSQTPQQTNANPPQPPQSPPNQAVNQVNKAKSAASHLRGLFGH